MSKNEDANAIRVLDADGTELRPTRNNKKVRKLIKSGRAKVECYDPFTIRLLREANSVSPPVTPAKEDLKMNFQIQDLNNADGLIVCKKGDGKVVTIDTDQNMLVFGDKHEKSMSYTMPLIMSLAQAGHSIVVTDPWGGYASEFSKYLEEKGYKITTYDFPDSFKGNFASLLIKNTDREQKLAVHQYAGKLCDELTGVKGSVYEIGAKVLMEALVLRVAYGHEFPVARKNLKSICDILAKPNVNDYLDTLFDENKLLAKEMCSATMYKAFKQGSSALCAHITMMLYFTLREKLLEQPELTGPVIGELAPKEAHFVKTVDTHNEFTPMVKDTLHALFESYLNKANTNRLFTLENPVHFIIEGRSITNMPELKEVLSQTYAKRNIFTCLAAASEPSDLEAILGKDWEKTLKNQNLILYYGQPTPDFLEYISSEKCVETDLGKRTVGLDKEKVAKEMRRLWAVFAVLQHNPDEEPVIGEALPYDCHPAKEEVK